MALCTDTFLFVGDTQVGSKITPNLLSAGYKAAAGLSSADVVFTYYETQEGLEDVYLAEGGLLAETKEDVLLVDLSATTPTFAKELFAFARVSERHVIDAPLVVGSLVGEAFSSPESLLMFVGAEAETFAVAEPMLKAIAARVEFVGVPGAGQAAKVATTLQDAASVVSLVEAYTAITYGEEKVDFDDYLDAVQATGVVAPKHVAVFEAVQARSFEGSYNLQMMMGELAAALTAMDDRDIILPQAEACFHLLELLSFVGGQQFNPAALSLAYADEQTCRTYGIDWSRAEEMFAEEEAFCNHNDPNHECSCGHHHGHEHGHGYSDEDSYPSDMLGFSEN